jgi:outer membrane protein TolC
VAAAAAVGLAGCATFSPDAGFRDVRALTEARTGHAARWQRTSSEAEAVRERVRTLLRQPLTTEAATEIALINNPRLQASVHELGIADADRVQAGRLRNPSFTFSNLRGGGAAEIERAIVFDVLSLFTLPLQSDFEQRRFDQTRLALAREAVTVAARARRAWVEAVASAEALRYHEQVKATADVSAELARRMEEAGNFSKLARMREQAFEADAAAQLARARQQAVADRERLARVLGLDAGEATFTLPERLPDLPQAPAGYEDIERVAMAQRLDILEAKQATQAVAKALQLTRATGFVNVLDAGYASKSATGEPRQQGYEIAVEVPLFDFGAVRRARAEATYAQAVARTRATALEVRSQVREAYAAYRTAFDVARHYRDEVVPLRKRISEENVLRYNAMLIGVFELLADARDQVASVTAAIAATRDFWVADSELQAALTAGAPAAASPERSTATSARTVGAEAGAH